MKIRIHIFAIISLLCGFTVLAQEIKVCRLNPDSLPVHNTSNRVKARSVADGVVNSYVPTSGTIDQSKAVGQIPITPGVSPSGAKTYEIPLELYPGINGFAPELKLVYNSQQGNGEYLGTGWSISGLSTITREGKNIYYDGKTEGIKFDNSDSFSLDGNRLVLIEEWGDSVLYETVNGNIKAKASRLGGVLSRFEVFYPDGNYGIFEGFNDNGKPLEYHIVSLQDPRGNVISYQYRTLHQNDFVISKIEYLGFSVRFQYGITNHQDGISYNAGIKSVRQELLTSVTCNFGTKQVRAYELAYNSHQNCALLEKVSLIASNESYNPIRFYYGDGNTVSEYATVVTQLLEWYEPEYPGRIRVERGKFDYETGNDGLIVLPNSSSYSLAKNSNNESILENKYKADDKIFLYAGLTDEFSTPMPDLVAGEGFVDIMCADLEGRQGESIIKVNNVGGIGHEKVSFSLYRSNPYSGISRYHECSFDLPGLSRENSDSVMPHPKFFYTGDFNGDGKMEVLAVSTHRPLGKSNGSRVYLFDLLNDNVALTDKSVFLYDYVFTGEKENTDVLENENNSDKLVMMDYDGDGKTDICHISSGGLSIYMLEDSKEGTLTLKHIRTNSEINLATLKNRIFFPVEMNGDGCMDLLVSPMRGQNTKAWTVYNSRGDGTFEKSTFSCVSYSDDNETGFIVQDINGDGLTDLIKYDANKFETYLAKRNKLEYAATTSFPAKNSALASTDINSRNTFSQLVSLDKGKATCYSFSDNIKQSTLLTGMVTSLGAVEKNQYEIIGENSEVYSMGANATFPYINVNEQLPVLTISETWEGGRKQEYSTYKYENGIMHRQGLGFTGFSKVTSDNSKGEHSKQYYDPFNFSVLTRELTNVSDNSYKYSIDRKSDKRVSVTLTEKVEKDLLKDISSTTAIVSDGYGNPVCETKSLTGGIQVRTESTYLNNDCDGHGYMLGMLKDKKMTTTRGGFTYVEETKMSGFDRGLPGVQDQYIDGNLVKHEEFTYDSYGNKLTEGERRYDSAVLLKTLREYDTMGRVTKETDPKGLVETYTYDANGRIATKTDCFGGVTSFQYDAFGREKSTTAPDGVVTSTEYSWISNTPLMVYSETKSQTGRPSEIKYYDRMNRVTADGETRFDGAILKTDRAYGANGEISTISLPTTKENNNYPTHYTYDNYNRLSRVEEASGRWKSYSYNKTSITTTADNITTTKTYDAQNHLVSVIDPGGTVTYTLHADGQPVSVTAPGNIVTTFGYDKYRRRTSISDPSCGTKTYGYDSFGNVSKEINANGEEIQYAYDSFNRLSQKITPEFTVTYTYDEHSLLTKVTNSNGTSREFTYDEYGRMTSRKDIAVDGVWFRQAYSYENGNISQVVHTSSNMLFCVEDRIYQNGHLSEIKLGNTTIYKLKSENALGLPSSVVTGPVERSYSYNNYSIPTGRKVQIPYKFVDPGDPRPIFPPVITNGTNGLGLGGAISRDSLAIEEVIVKPGMRRKELDERIRLNHTYVFDNETRNLMSRSNKLRKTNESFGYDELNRLISFGDVTSEYNEKGNIISRSDIGDLEYNVTGKPYAVSGVTLTGTAVPLRSQSIAYTSFSRPASISENGNVATFVYDADYDRVKMSVSSGDKETLTRYYLGGCYERERNEDGTVERLYLGGDYYKAVAVVVSKSGSGSGFLVRNSSQPYYILRDYMGSITAVVDSTGYTVDECSYDPWGRMRSPSTLKPYAPDKDPGTFLGRGYTGHEHLPMFGLINMNARLYDPALGRFLSPDPYVQSPEMTQNFNRYSYALNNPLKYTDPNGEFFLTTIFTAIRELVINICSRGTNFGHYSWNRTVNAWKIDMGMFKGNFKQILNKWTWGAFTSYVGNTVAYYLNNWTMVDKVTNMNGMLALAGVQGTKGSAFTIGHLSFGPNDYTATWRDHLFVHEYGHYIQSQKFGPAYLFAIGIPSLCSAKWSSYHRGTWCEYRASKLGADYMDRHYGVNSGYRDGNGHSFDRDAFERGIYTPYENPRYSQLYNPDNPDTADYRKGDDDNPYWYQGGAYPTTKEQAEKRRKLLNL